MEGTNLSVHSNMRQLSVVCNNPVPDHIVPMPGESQDLTGRGGSKIHLCLPKCVLGHRNGTETRTEK